MAMYWQCAAETSLDRGNYDISWYSAQQREFTLENAQQLAGVAFLVNNGYDSFSGKVIELSQGCSFELKECCWVPIGTENNPFKGSMFGNDRSIILQITDGSSKDGDSFGLFGYAEDAHFENISISVSSVMTIDCSLTKINFGSIVGKASNTDFVKCSNSSPIDITVHSPHAVQYVVRCGGLVGYGDNCGFVQCDNRNGVSAALKAGDFGACYTEGSCLLVGGIIGAGTNIELKSCMVGTTSEQERDMSIRMLRAPSRNTCSSYSSLGALAGSLSGVSSVKTCRALYVEVFSAPYTPSSSTSDLVWNRYIGGLVGKFSSGKNAGIYNSYSAAALYNTGYNAIEGGIAGQFPTSNDWGGNFSWCTKSYGSNGGYNGITSFSSRKEMISEEFVSALNLWPSINWGECTWSQWFPYRFPEDISYKSEFYAEIDGFRYYLHKEEGVAELYYLGSEDFNYIMPYSPLNHGVAYPGVTYAKIPSVIFFNKEYTVTQLTDSFMKCKTLEVVDLPVSITNISSGTFRDCTALNKIICRALTAPSVVVGTFFGIDVSEIILVIDENADDTYEKDEIWSKFQIVREDLGGAGINTATTDQISSPIYFDIYGRRVLRPRNGQIIIEKGRKFIYCE